MNLKQVLKITLLIVILAEEIKSVKTIKSNERQLITNQNHLLKEFLKANRSNYLRQSN